MKDTAEDKRKKGYLFQPVVGAAVHVIWDEVTGVEEVEVIVVVLGPGGVGGVGPTRDGDGRGDLHRRKKNLRKSVQDEEKSCMEE